MSLDEHCLTSSQMCVTNAGHLTLSVLGFLLWEMGLRGGLNEMGHKELGTQGPALSATVSDYSDVTAAPLVADPVGEWPRHGLSFHLLSP